MNRRQRRAASCRPAPRPAAKPPGGIGWSIEVKAYGGTVGLALDPALNHELPEEGASVCIRLLLVAMIVDGADRGWWRRPAEWLNDASPPPGMVEWYAPTVQGTPTRVARFGRGIGMVQGPPEVARQLMLSLLNALADGDVKPTREAHTGGYDERNLTPMVRGGDA